MVLKILKKKKSSVMSGISTLSSLSWQEIENFLVLRVFTGDIRYIVKKCQSVLPTCLFKTP